MRAITEERLIQIRGELKGSHKQGCALVQPIIDELIKSDIQEIDQLVVPDVIDHYMPAAKRNDWYEQNMYSQNARVQARYSI